MKHYDQQETSNQVFFILWENHSSLQDYQNLLFSRSWFSNCFESRRALLGLKISPGVLKSLSRRQLKQVRVCWASVTSCRLLGKISGHPSYHLGRPGRTQAAWSFLEYFPAWWGKRSHLPLKNGKCHLDAPWVAPSDGFWWSQGLWNTKPKKDFKIFPNKHHLCNT